MNKVIALQSSSQDLASILTQQGYTVIDMYQAYQQREKIDAYLYTTYHPDALTAYHSTSYPEDSPLDTVEEKDYDPKTLMLNITDLASEQILIVLERRLSAT